MFEIKSKIFKVEYEHENEYEKEENKINQINKINIINKINRFGHVAHLQSYSNDEIKIFLSGGCNFSQKMEKFQIEELIIQPTNSFIRPVQNANFPPRLSHSFVPVILFFILFNYLIIIVNF